MGTSNPQAAASYASQVSGLPVAVTTTLIQQEGPSQSAPNNPFDITDQWASLTGFGNIVTTLWNDLGGGHGVAVTNNEQAAIQSWWKGLQTFSAYGQLRQLQAQGSTTVQQWFNALSATGYGGSSAYGAELGNTFRSLTGKDPNTTLLNATGVALPASPTTTTTSTTGISITTATTSPSVLNGVGATASAGTIPVPPTATGSGNANITLPDGITIDLSGIQSAINAVGTNIGGIPTTIANGIAGALNPIVSEINNVNAFFTWLGNPHLWLRLFLGLLGLVFVVIGLGFLGYSFVPQGVKQDAGTALTAVA